MDSESTATYRTYLDKGLTGSTSSLDALYEGTRGPYSDQNLLAPSRPSRDRSRNAHSGRLVIGVDFGTTHTSLAYAFVSSYSAPLDVKRDVIVVSDWTSRMQNMEKIPSVISYSPAPNGHEQWGADLSDDAVALVNIKLDLAVQPNMLDELELTWNALEMAGFLSFELVKLKQSRPHTGYTRKTPEQIVTDYLKKILKSLLRNFHNSFADELIQRIPTDIVMTIPVDWRYEAGNSIFRAFQSAGFSIETFPKLQDLIFITEPEAACIFIARQLQEKQEKSPLRLNECFILCKASSIMVEVTAFQVTQLEPRIELKQIAHPSSGKYGATFVDQSFKTWLRRIIGNANYRTLDPEETFRSINRSFHPADRGTLKRLMNVFETRRNLFNHGTGMMYIDLPHPLDNLTIPSRLNEGELTIRPEDMKAFFDPCVDNIVLLIQSQIHQVEMLHRRVRNVFLIGGFGASPYLQHELHQSLSVRKISLRRPDPYTQTTVVQGAVIYGAEKSLHQNPKFCSPSPQSYGIVVNEFAAHEDGSRDQHRDELSDEPIARQHFAWLIRRGDLILSGEKTMAQKQFTHISRTFDNIPYDLPIYTYSDADNDVPKNWATDRHEVQSIGGVNIDLSTVPLTHYEQLQNKVTGQIHLAIDLMCRMSITSELLEVDISANEHRVGYTKIRFSELEQDSSSDFDD